MGWPKNKKIKTLVGAPLSGKDSIKNHACKDRQKQHQKHDDVLIAVVKRLLFSYCYFHMKGRGCGKGGRGEGGRGKGEGGRGKVGRGKGERGRGKGEGGRGKGEGGKGEGGRDEIWSLYSIMK